MACGAAPCPAATPARRCRTSPRSRPATPPRRPRRPTPMMPSVTTSAPIAPMRIGNARRRRSRLAARASVSHCRPSAHARSAVRRCPRRPSSRPSRLPQPLRQFSREKTLVSSVAPGTPPPASAAAGSLVKFTAPAAPGAVPVRARGAGRARRPGRHRPVGPAARVARHAPATTRPRPPKASTRMMTTTSTGTNGRGAHQLNATAQSSSAGGDGDEPDRDPAAAQPVHEPVDRRVRGALLRDGRPGQQVGEHAGTAEERGGREQHPEQHRVDVEVLAQAARDAGADPIGAAAAQQPRRTHGGGAGGGGGGADAAMLAAVSRSGHGSNSAALGRSAHRDRP